MSGTARKSPYTRRVVTYEIEYVYPTDLLVRWLVRKWKEWRS